MKRNRIRLIQLVTLLLIILALLFIKNNLSQFLPKKPDQPFSTLKKEQIRQILLTKDKTTFLYKKDKVWYVKKGSQEFRADTERINNIIDSFVSLSKNEVISSNKKKHKSLGIDKQKIEIKTNGKTYAIYIGSITGLSKNYIRIGDDNEVFIVEGFAEVFTSEDYRDLIVHLINDETKVTLIEINFEDNKTILTKRGNDWKIGDKTAKKDRVDFFLNDLKTLKANDILPKDTILAQVISGQIAVNENANKKSIMIYSKDEDNYLTKTSESEFVFQIPAAYVASLKKEEKDFVE